MPFLSTVRLLGRDLWSLSENYLEKCPQSKTAFMLSCLPSHSPTAAHSNRTTSLRFPYYFSFTFLLSKSLAHSFSLSSHCRFRLSLYDSTARSLLADSHCILSLIYRHYLRIILIRIVRYRYPNNGKNSVYRYCELYVFFHVFKLVIYSV